MLMEGKSDRRPTSAFGWTVNTKISYRISSLADAYHVWSTSVNASVSYPAHRQTDKQTNNRAHNSALLEYKLETYSTEGLQTDASARSPDLTSTSCDLDLIPPDFNSRSPFPVDHLSHLAPKSFIRFGNFGLRWSWPLTSWPKRWPFHALDPWTTCASL